MGFLTPRTAGASFGEDGGFESAALLAILAQTSTIVGSSDLLAQIPLLVPPATLHAAIADEGTPYLSTKT